MAFFEQVSGQLEGIEQQQTDLRRAVDSGALWMEADVAERETVQATANRASLVRQVVAVA